MNVRALARRTASLWGALTLVAAASCAGGSQPSPDPATSTPTTEPTAAAAPTPPPPASGPSDPFAAQPDESEGLTNVSADLDAVLEHGALTGACDRYKAGQKDRKTMLLCGKWMYFYETFGTSGMPSAVVKFLAQNFPDELGDGFSKLGLVLDPTSPDKLPLGIAPTAPMNGNIDALAFTCASCHFAQLPDKRYAVGAPNHDYEYGTHILALTLAPTIGMGMENASDHHPDAVARVQPVIDRLSNDFTLKARFGAKLLPLASMKLPGLTKDIEGQYAHWPKGTLDFIIAPLPVDDGVEVVGKMIGLWGIPRDAEIAASGMKNGLLAWTGDATSIHSFLQGFALFGGAPTPSDADLAPLEEFIYSLRAPTNPNPPDPARVAEGAALFTAKGCATCHDGPRGSGKRVYTFAEIGTDDALARWADPTLSGSACCNIPVQPGILQHGVKSPRMVGMWALQRFLHNGSLTSLEQLFCLDARPAGAAPMRSDGHAFTCDALSDSEKRSLIAFLLAH